MDKKKTEIALKGVELLRKDLAKEYPYLLPAIYYLIPMLDEKEKSISTDGKYLFIQSDHILKCYRTASSYQGLKYQYLHILLHCILGHIVKKNQGKDKIYDLCVDFIADIGIQKLTGKGRKIPWNLYAQYYEPLAETYNGKALSGFLESVEQNKELRNGLLKLGNYLESDDHQYWTKENALVKESGITEKPDWKELQEIWKDIEKQTEAIKAMISEQSKGKTGGCFSSEAIEQETRAAEENLSNYKELLQRLCSAEEILPEDDKEIDYIWYRLGMEMYGNIPLVEPAECVEEMVCNHIIIAIDTSGSCSGEMASRFLRETCNILEDLRLKGREYEIRIMECDDKINHEVVIHNKDEIPDLQAFTMYGYGGTDFRPVFRRIQELREKNEVTKINGLIYLTDAEGIFPEEKTDYETIFMVLNDFNDHIFQEIPDWITKMRITEDAFENAEC